MLTLSRSEWHVRRMAHRSRLHAFVDPHLRRAGNGEKHPVFDFLFTYYSFRPAHLLRWSPGIGVRLEDHRSADWPDHFGNDGVIAPERFPVHRQSFLDWAIDYQAAILHREPAYGCFGLHEWAMVYRTGEIRHERVPLRHTENAIAEVVESQGLRCTHYDAFRFFTAAAAPRNRIALTRAATPEHDQPGCLHANMDLYKFAYTVAPFTTGELIADTFELARSIRELDMRASPYDLRAFGFEPIRIEESAGREEYVHHQRRFASMAIPLRQRLLNEYRHLRCNAAVTQ